MDEDDDMMMEDEDYDDESEGSMILAFNEDGVAELINPEEIVQMKKSDMDLINAFLKEHQKEFTEFAKNKLGEKPKE